MARLKAKPRATIKDLVDITSNDCDMRRCFNLIAQSNDFFVAYEWLAQQNGINVVALQQLSELIGFSNHTLQEAIALQGQEK